MTCIRPVSRTTRPAPVAPPSRNDDDGDRDGAADSGQSAVVGEIPSYDSDVENVVASVLNRVVPLAHRWPQWPSQWTTGTMQSILVGTSTTPVARQPQGHDEDDDDDDDEKSVVDGDDVVEDDDDDDDEDSTSGDVVHGTDYDDDLASYVDDLAYDDDDIDEYVNVDEGEPDAHCQTTPVVTTAIVPYRPSSLLPPAPAALPSSSATSGTTHAAALPTSLPSDPAHRSGAFLDWSPSSRRPTLQRAPSPRPDAFCDALTASLDLNLNLNPYRTVTPARSPAAVSSAMSAAIGRLNRGAPPQGEVDPAARSRASAVAVSVEGIRRNLLDAFRFDERPALVSTGAMTLRLGEA
ncbi:Uncharacterized protein PBTT_08988 [Plasmodiophora brassicae]